MDLSIIIINYQTRNLTAQCLKSIKNSKDNLKKEVIVIDNHSQDDSPEYLIKNFSFINLIKSNKNLGFAKGNNLGVKKAKGKYILFLNSDTLLKSDSLQLLYNQVLKNHSSIASCQLLNQDKSIQSQGGCLPNLFTVFAWMLFIDDLPFIKDILMPYHQNNLSFFKKDQSPGWLSGTALLVKKQIFQKLKGFDPHFFMYGEDVDFCLRAKKMGFKLNYFHKPQIIHLCHGSGNQQSALLGEFQGLKYIYKKHQASWQYPLLRLLLKTGALLRLIIYLIKNEKDKSQTYFKAFQLA